MNFRKIKKPDLESSIQVKKGSKHLWATAPCNKIIKRSSPFLVNSQFQIFSNWNWLIFPTVQHALHLPRGTGGVPFSHLPESNYVHQRCQVCTQGYSTTPEAVFTIEFANYSSLRNIWFGNMKEIKCFDYSGENLLLILCSMYKDILYSNTMQVVENYIYYFYGNV